MNTDPFWKRSAFGSLLFAVGLLGIGYLYGRIPQEVDLINVLGLVLTVLGYTTFRPTGPVQ